MLQVVKTHPIVDIEEPKREQFEMELTTEYEEIDIFAVQENGKEIHSNKVVMYKCLKH